MVMESFFLFFSHFICYPIQFCFGKRLSTDVMSLRPNTDACALSLAVELNEDGSIQKDSIQVMTSKIQIQYRLTYDDVDEMLQEGVAYREEWELGELFRAANQRRAYRIRNGSTEGFIPHSIPHSFVSLFDDNDESEDGIGIRLTIDSSHNQGRNRTTESTISMNTNVQSVSDSNVLVTEMMILAGEALGQWKLRSDREDVASTKVNDDAWQIQLPPWTLPFRGQATPQWEKRAQETQILHDLKRKQEEEEQEQQHQQYQQNHQQQQQQVHAYPKFGYCHAWYARRFLSPVSIGPKPTSHFGLGVPCYIQWTSPIRRLGDLQVHAAVKRYLRRCHIVQLYREGKCLPKDIRNVDIGCSLTALLSAATTTRTDDVEEKKGNDDDDNEESSNMTFHLDSDIDFNYGKSLVAASKSVHRHSQQYWLFEYIRRQIQRQESTLSSIQLDGIVLGCVDPDRLQYAIYLPEIGYEHRYVSQKGFLQVGEVLKLEVESIYPRMGLLTLSLINVG
jgi:exoribonuclease R